MHSVAADLLESKQHPLRQSSIQTAPVPSQQFTMPVLAASSTTIVAGISRMHNARSGAARFPAVGSAEPPSSTLLPPREPRLALLQEVGDALAEVLGVAADR